VARHLAALGEKAPDLLPIYRALGLRAVELARRKGEADADGLATIARALEVIEPRP